MQLGTKEPKTWGKPSATHQRASEISQTESVRKT